MPIDQRARALAAEVCKQLADAGKLVEGGWESYKIVVLAPDLSAVEYDRHRTSYFAGAQHLFASIMSVMDDNDEPSDADMKKMSLISKELEDSARDLELLVTPAKGSG